MEKTRLSWGSSDMFPLLTEFLGTNSMTIDCVRDRIVAHLSMFTLTIFSTFAMSSYHFSGQVEQELLDLSCDRTLKIKFQEQTLCQSWPTVAAAYPVLVTDSMKVPFSTTYICDASFSAMTAMKTKFRSRLEVENDAFACQPRHTHFTDIYNYSYTLFLKALLTVCIK